MSTHRFVASARVVFLFVSFNLSSAHAGFTMVTGKYTGDGSGSRAINVGFAPDVVIIKGNNSRPAYCATSTMVQGDSRRLDLAYAVMPNRIVALTVTGFLIGSDVDVNQAGDSYCWIAFQKQVGSLAVGTYTGNGIDNRNLTGIGFQPSYVIVMAETAKLPYQYSSAMPADRSGSFTTGLLVSDRIQAMQPDGFQLGKSSDVNASGAVFHYIAFKAESGLMAVGSYAGNGSTNRDIAGLGFAPGWVLVRPSSLANPVHRPISSDGDPDNKNTQYFRSLPNYDTGLQKLQADGFQVGNDTSVNGSGTTYYWMGFYGTDINATTTKPVKVLKWIESR